MFLSNYFVKTQKEDPSYEQSVNAKLLIRAGFIHQEMAGVYTFLPMGLKTLRNIENIIRDEMDNIGGQEILMPSLQPKSNWQTTGRWETYDALFKFVSYYTNIDYAIGPTHEEVITPMMKRFILSYKDLPTYVYQIQDKFRDEKRAKSGILRGREFGMKDLYSFHINKEDLENYYEKAIEAYRRIFDRLGIGDKTYLTYAGGGTFSKYSHEFQTITPAGEDIIYLCEKCNVAVNEEIIEEQNTCPECGNNNLKQEKSIEVGNIFKLGTGFSDPFELMYKDKDGQENPVIMGCYGIGTGRVMGAIVETLNDENGMKWPSSIAPYKYVIVPIGNNLEKAKEIYNYLKDNGEKVVLDDREGSPGYKFKDADLIGYPYKIIVSDKTLQEGEHKIELNDRFSGDKQIIDYKHI